MLPGVRSANNGNQLVFNGCTIGGDRRGRKYVSFINNLPKN